MKIKYLIQNKYFVIPALIIALSIISANGFSNENMVVKPDFGGFITIDGNRIHYIQKGTGSDVLLVHGLPGSIEDWEDVIDLLAETYRVTAFDRPGFGASSEDNVRATIEQNAETVIMLIKKLGLHNVVLVGHSYGGSTILRVAIKDPEPVKAYIAIAAVGYPVKRPDFMLRLAALPYIGRALAFVSTPLFGKKMVADGLKKAFFPNEAFLTENLIKSRQKSWLRLKVVSATAREEVNMNQCVEKSIPGYDQIKKPVFIVQGKEDRLVDPESAVKLHRAIKHSKLVMLEHTGHQVQFVHPDKVIEIIHAAAFESNPNP